MPDPFEEKPSRTPNAGAVSDDIDVAPALARTRPVKPASVGQSWSALEAAGLLPKRDTGQVDKIVTSDGWPSEGPLPSGTVAVVARTVPPPPPGGPSPILPSPTPTLTGFSPTETAIDDRVPEPLAVPAPNQATEIVARTAFTSPTPVVVAPIVQAAALMPFNDAPDVRSPRIVAKTVGRRRLFGRRPRVRKVSRVVRRIDAWTVFKISLVLYLLLYVVLLIAGVLLWRLAGDTGTIDNIQGFIKELFGLKTFTINGKKLFDASRGLGLFLAIAGTGLHVTLAVLFNLIADLVGGVRVTVLEEEVILRERLRGGPVAESIVADSDQGDNLTAS